jgi:hypothetical protein
MQYVKVVGCFRHNWIKPYGLFLLAFTGFLQASTLTYTGLGGDFNLATFDANGDPVPAVTTFEIPISDLAVIDSGDSVMISLAGLQYAYAGDLQATLFLRDASGNVVASADLFNQIGAVSSGGPGYETQFGNSFTTPSGNYSFDSSYTGDLWATAAPLGTSDSIPSGNYFPTSLGSSANDNLSSQFAGQLLMGSWVLTITDYYPPFNGGPLDFPPGLTSWTVDAQATQTTSATPEPSMALPVFACAAGLWCFLRRKPRQTAANTPAIRT